ncbi:MAG: hypothetical protein CMH69_18140 [Nitratireductor sp.]|jgi:hypothetical protein|nr:hypothetical protein [Nitratireductor sp.]
MATISKPDRSLDSSILAAFKVAHDQGKLEVAEHLLSALECLDRTAGRGGVVEKAYRMICPHCEREDAGTPKPRSKS